MDMSANKNATDRSIGKKLRIGDRIPVAAVHAAHVAPMLINPAIHEERLGCPIVRDQSAVRELERLTAAVGIVGYTRSFSSDLGDRLVCGIAEEERRQCYYSAIATGTNLTTDKVDHLLRKWGGYGRLVQESIDRHCCEGRTIVSMGRGWGPTDQMSLFYLLRVTGSGAHRQRVK